MCFSLIIDVNSEDQIKSVTTKKGKRKKDTDFAGSFEGRYICILCLKRVNTNTHQGKLVESQGVY